MPRDSSYQWSPIAPRPSLDQTACCAEGSSAHGIKVEHLILVGRANLSDGTMSNSKNSIKKVQFGGRPLALGGSEKQGNWA